jgi:hypothetical protein
VIMEAPLRSGRSANGPALAEQTLLRQLRFHHHELVESPE